MIGKNVYTLQGLVWLMLSLVMVPMVQAEESLIVDLSEELAEQAQVFTEKKRSLESLKTREEESRLILNKIRRAAPHSQDHSYAVAQYVQSRLAVLGPKIDLVDELIGVNGDISTTMGRLADAFDEKARQQGIATDVPKEVLLRTITHFEGSGSLLSTLAKDPVIQGAPELQDLIATFKIQQANLNNSINTYRGNTTEQLYRLRNLADTRDALLRTIGQRLRSELDRLQLIHSQSITSTVAVKIKGVLDSMYDDGVLSDEMSDVWYQADSEVMKSTEMGVFDAGFIDAGSTPSHQITDQMRLKLGLPEKELRIPD